MGICRREQQGRRCFAILCGSVEHCRQNCCLMVINNRFMSSVLNPFLIRDPPFIWCSEKKIAVPSQERFSDILVASQFSIDELVFGDCIFKVLVMAPSSVPLTAWTWAFSHPVSTYFPNGLSVLTQVIPFAVYLRKFDDMGCSEGGWSCSRVVVVALTSTGPNLWLRIPAEYWQKKSHFMCSPFPWCLRLTCTNKVPAKYGGSRGRRANRTSWRGAELECFTNGKKMSLILYQQCR